MKSILKNDSVFLRAVEPTDLERLLAWENNTGYWQVSHTLTPFSKELLQQYVYAAQDIYAVKQIRLMIGDSPTGETVGAIDLFDFEPRHQRAGVGILIDENFRNAGRGKQALELLKSYALEVVGIRNLFATILANNAASLALFEKAGFEKIGERKKSFQSDRLWLNESLYQCTLT